VHNIAAVGPSAVYHGWGFPPSHGCVIGWPKKTFRRVEIRS
jgi:hypothetical protein